MAGIEPASPIWDTRVTTWLDKPTVDSNTKMSLPWAELA